MGEGEGLAVLSFAGDEEGRVGWLLTGVETTFKAGVAVGLSAEGVLVVEFPSRFSKMPFWAPSLKPHSLEITSEKCSSSLRLKGSLLVEGGIVLAIRHLEGVLSVSPVWRQQSTHVVTLGLEPVHRLLSALVTLGEIASASK